MATRRPSKRWGLAALRRGIGRRPRRRQRPDATRPMTWRQAYRRLLRAVNDERAVVLRSWPSEADVTRAGAGAALLRARATFVEELLGGAPGPRALISCVRRLCRHRHFQEAEALAGAMGRIAGLSDAGHAAGALVMATRGRFRAARLQLRALSREAALDLVPAELVAVEFAEDPPTAVATCRCLLDGAGNPEPEAWLALARTTFGRGELDLTVRALDRFAGRATHAPPDVRKEARWLRSWVARAEAPRRPDPVPPGHVAFAVLDYKQPDLHQVSVNVGDYVQTLASLGHLVRHQNLRFQGDAGLVAALSGLQARVRPDQRLRAVDGDVTVLAVNRDASSLDAVPEGTWMLAFGWYMHSWFKTHYDFPFHPNLRPVFVSFHLNRRRTLTEQSVTYLRRHAPIGCRDWDTVHLLLELGVPAFFSGCLTTTVDTLFTPKPPHRAADAPVALVDLPPGQKPSTGRSTVTVQHSIPDAPAADLVDNLGVAVRMLEGYRRDFAAVVTSRLHCYLPVRALGVDVQFRPKNASDIRFDGLVGIDDAGFAAMQRGIRDKLQAVLSSILRGDDEDTVRAIWRQVCADDVEAARRRHQDPWS